MQHDTLRHPVVAACQKGAAGVHGSVVNNDDARFFMDGVAVAIVCGKQVEGPGHLFSFDAPFNGVEKRPAVPGNKPQDIEALAMETGDFQRLAFGLPGVRHGGRGAEAGFVKIEQADFVFIVPFFQGGLDVLGLGKALGTTPAFYGAPAPPP